MYPDRELQDMLPKVYSKILDKIIIHQGEDVAINIPVLNASDGSQHTLTEATNIVVGLLVSNVLQTKFSLVDTPGYGTLTVASNVITVLLRRGQSQNYQVGNLKAAVLIQEPGTAMPNIRTEFVVEIGAIVASTLATEPMAMTQPAAPTLPVVVSGVSVAWTIVTGFPNPDDYEISVNGGMTYTPVTSNPYPVVTTNYTTGQIMVRVAANPGTDTEAGIPLLLF